MTQAEGKTEARRVKEFWEVQELRHRGGKANNVKKGELRRKIKGGKSPHGKERVHKKRRTATRTFQAGQDMVKRLELN